MVKIGRLVAGKAIGVGAAVGAVLLAAYIFRKSDAGAQIVQSLKGAGSVGGQAIIAPIEGLLGGVAAGIGGLTETTAKIGSNLGSFQDAFAAGDFQSIADGSYVTKYGGVGSAPSGKTVTAPPFSKETVSDESANDKSSIKQNFNPPKIAIAQVSLSSLATKAQAALQKSTQQKSISLTGKTFKQSTGFSSFEAQRSALTKALEDSRRKYPQYFKK